MHSDSHLFKVMKNYIKSFFWNGPAIGRWEDYEDYCMRWREDWNLKLKIVAHRIHKGRTQVKFELL